MNSEQIRILDESLTCYSDEFSSLRKLMVEIGCSVLEAVSERQPPAEQPWWEKEANAHALACRAHAEKYGCRPGTSVLEFVLRDAEAYREACAMSDRREHAAQRAQGVQPIMKCCSCEATTDDIKPEVAWPPPYPACGRCGAMLVDKVQAPAKCPKCGDGLDSSESGVCERCHGNAAPAPKVNDVVERCCKAYYHRGVFEALSQCEKDACIEGMTAALRVAFAHDDKLIGDAMRLVGYDTAGSKAEAFWAHIREGRGIGEKP